MPFHLSGKAEEDVISIFVQGAAEFGVEHAGRDHAALERQFQFLEDNPLVARERLEIDPPVHVHPFLAHIVVYTLDPGGDVYILRCAPRTRRLVSDALRAASKQQRARLLQIEGPKGIAALPSRHLDRSWPLPSSRPQRAPTPSSRP